MTFAQNFKTYKELQGISNYKLAKLLNCSQSTVANWLNGNSEPSPSQIASIALALKCSFSDLLDNSVENKKNSDLKSELDLVCSKLSQADKDKVMEYARLLLQANK